MNANLQFHREAVDQMMEIRQEERHWLNVVSVIYGALIAYALKIVGDGPSLEIAIGSIVVSTAITLVTINLFLSL